VAEPRFFCSELSAAGGEPLGATASRVAHWIVVEYRGLWARDELGASLLSDGVKEHLRAQLLALPRSRLLFVRRPERRLREGVAVFYGLTSQSETRFYALEVAEHDDLRSLELAAALAGAAPPPGKPLAHPLLVVCTHGKRDPCCARYGRPLYEGLREAAHEGWVWQSTHVGGDRFAGNLVCLPEGIYYGRAGRLDALSMLDEHLAGRIDLGRYRGRCWYSFPVQAAEREARVRDGASGIDDVEVERVERTGDGSWLVRLAVRGIPQEVEVVAEQGELTRLTCSSPTLKSPLRFRARSARTLPAQGA
jgi:hypothetical protein